MRELRRAAVARSNRIILDENPGVAGDDEDAPAGGDLQFAEPGVGQFHMQRLFAVGEQFKLKGEAAMKM